MAITTPLGYNPSASPISGTDQVGTLAVGVTDQDYSIDPGGIKWWMAPDESTGYVIAVPVSGNTQPTPLFTGNLTLSSTYKGSDILLVNSQLALQQFGYQQSVLGQTLINDIDKVMFSVQSNVCPNPGNPFFQSIGIGTTSMNYQGNPYGAYPGNDGQSVGFSMDGNFYYNGSIVQSGLPTWSAANDLIDVAVDLSNGLIWIRVNGFNWNNNLYANPAIGTGGLPLYGLTSFYPVLSPGNNAGQMTILNSPYFLIPEGYQVLGANVNASVGFYQTTGLTDGSFIELTNNVFSQNFSSATDASVWLTNNGYWNSYPAPVLYLDAGNLTSYPGTGTVWTDLVGGKQFNLINGPGYNSANGGKFYFSAPNSQYAYCSTSLPSLPIFTTAVWHYWDGTNTGLLPCILTEVYVGGGINFVLGAPTGDVASGGYFNGGFQLSGLFGISPNTWYQIVTTCDSYQNVKVYVNSLLVASSSTSGSQPYSSGAGINLMKRWDGTDYWGGYLSTVGIYDKALTPGQILGIYNTTKSRFGY
jgi:Concanavalin A-like lectin/glucanases superfamily